MAAAARSARGLRFFFFLLLSKRKRKRLVWQNGKRLTRPPARAFAAGLRCRDGEPVAQWLRRGGRNAVDAVELAGNSLGAAGLRQLAAALTDPGCGRLATLDLSANEICLIAAR